MRRAIAAVLCGVALGLAWGEGLRCVAEHLDLGSVVRVHPAIRALDAGRRTD